MPRTAGGKQDAAPPAFERVLFFSCGLPRRQKTGRLEGPQRIYATNRGPDADRFLTAGPDNSGDIWPAGDANNAARPDAVGTACADENPIRRRGDKRPRGGLLSFQAPGGSSSRSRSVKISSNDLPIWAATSSSRFRSTSAGLSWLSVTFSSS